MLSGHVVESLCFEVGFAAEGPAFAWQSRLERFARRRMVEVVGEVFDELSAAGEVWRLERVEVDLGMVAEGDGEVVWVERLRDGLRRALGEQRRGLGAAGGGDGSGSPGHDGVALAHAMSQPRVEAELGWLLFFLAHGHLPWGTGAVDASALQAMALRVVAVSGAALAAALRAGDVGERMARRLAWQFDGRVCGAVMAVASGPSTRAGWGSLDRGSAAVWRELGLRAALAPTVAAVRDGEVSVGDVGLAGRQVRGSGSGVALDGAPASASSPARAGAARAANDRPLARAWRRGGIRRAANENLERAAGEVDAKHAPSFVVSLPKDRGEHSGAASSGNTAARRAIDRPMRRERVSTLLRLALVLSLNSAREGGSAVLRQAQDERAEGRPDDGDAFAPPSDGSSAGLSTDDDGRDGIDPVNAIVPPAVDQPRRLDEAGATADHRFVPSPSASSGQALSKDQRERGRAESVDHASSTALHRLSASDEPSAATPDPLILSPSASSGQALSKDQHKWGRAESVDHASSAALHRSSPSDESNAAAPTPLILSPPASSGQALSMDDAERSRHHCDNGSEVPAIDQSQHLDRADAPAAPPLILSLSKDHAERSRHHRNNGAEAPAIDQSQRLDRADAPAAPPLILSLSKDHAKRSRHHRNNGTEAPAVDQSQRLDRANAPAAPPLILSPSKDTPDRSRSASSDPVALGAIDRREDSHAVLRQAQDERNLASAISSNTRSGPSLSRQHDEGNVVLRQAQDERGRGSPDSGDALSTTSLSSLPDGSNTILRQAQDERSAASSTSSDTRPAPGLPIERDEGSAVLRQAQDERGRGSPDSGDALSTSGLSTQPDGRNTVLRQAQDELSPASPTSSDARPAPGLPRQRDEGSAVLRQTQDERGWGSPDSGDALSATSLSSLPDGSNTVLRQAQDERSAASPTSIDTRPAPGLQRQHVEGNLVLRQAQDERDRGSPDGGDALSATSPSSMPDGSNTVLRQAQDERGRGSPDSGDALSTSGLSTHPDRSNAALRLAQDEQGEWHSDSSNPPSPPSTSIPRLTRRSSPRHQALALRIRLLADACAAAHAPALRPHITALGALLLHRLPPSFDLHYATVQLLHDTLMSLLPPRPSSWCRALQQPLADGQAPAHREAARSLAEALATLDRDFAAPANTPAETTPTTDAPLYIANAGLVLAAPYLPRLWSMLDLAGPRAFVHPAAAHRAVHLTQYLVTGDNDHPTPEHHLVLNKLICGVPIAEPITAAIDITTAEREAIHGLLQSMIQHWKILGRTSVAGLRESFLQREGRLLCSDEAWNLQVQPRAFDMLLDQIPWGYATLRFPWMERLIHVDWR